jgi:hypothetical protein
MVDGEMEGSADGGAVEEEVNVEDDVALDVALALPTHQRAIVRIPTTQMTLVAVALALRPTGFSLAAL